LIGKVQDLLRENLELRSKILKLEGINMELRSRLTELDRKLTAEDWAAEPTARDATRPVVRVTPIDRGPSDEEPE